MSFERSFETGRISVMKGSRRVLVKVVLFQWRGCGHAQSDATPSFFPYSESSILGLSNELSFVSRYYCKISENWEKEESIIRPYVSKRVKLYIFLEEVIQDSGRTFKVLYSNLKKPHFVSLMVNKQTTINLEISP